MRERLFYLALGYEDLNETTLTYAAIRSLATAVGKEDVLGEDRRCAKDAGFACASPATLVRLELGVRCLQTHSKVLILDFDATDDPLHGRQEGRFFLGYYGSLLPAALLFLRFGAVVGATALERHGREHGNRGGIEKIVAAIRQMQASKNSSGIGSTGRHRILGFDGREIFLSIGYEAMIALMRRPPIFWKIRCGLHWWPSQKIGRIDSSRASRRDAPTWVGTRRRPCPTRIAGP